jgi:hypothetical protein
MEATNIKKLYKCINSIIDIFINETKTTFLAKERKDLIMQLDKLTSLVIKLNKLQNNNVQEDIKIDQKDEKIMEELIKIYGNAKQ